MQDDVNFDNPKSNWLKDLFIIFTLGMVLYLGLSFMRPLASPDEGRYSEIPREMAVSGDWVTPRLNGMPYFYKPPMFYWMQAASIKAFGVSKISVRFANSMMAVLGACAAYCAARALYGRMAGIMSAAVLSTSLLYYALGQIITLDMTVAVFLSMALFCFIVALKRSGVWRGALIVGFFAFCALALLTKGLIGIVAPAAVIFFYALALGVFGFFRQLKWSDLAWCALGIVVFLAISAPWHILATLANPPYETSEGLMSKVWEGQGFFWYYIVHEHVLRFVDAETSMRAKPFWFFLVLAPVGLIPWIFVLPQAVFDSLKGGWKNLVQKNPEFIFFSVWVIFIVFFFSISKSKLAPYIIPIYPALAVIIGAWLAKVWRNPQNYKLKAVEWILICGGYLLSFSPIAIYLIQVQKNKIIDHNAAIITFSIFGGCMFILTSVALLIKLKSQNPHKLFAAIYAAILLLFIGFNPMGIFLQRPSAEPLVEVIKQQRKAGDSVAIAYDYGAFQDLPVWLGELPVIIGSPPEEQKFGYMRERVIHCQRFLETRAEIENYVNTRKGAIFIAARWAGVEDLKKLNLPVKEIFSNGDLYLLKIDGK